jgi:hypothetical protein
MAASIAVMEKCGMSFLAKERSRAPSDTASPSRDEKTDFLDFQDE